MTNLGIPYPVFEDKKTIFMMWVFNKSDIASVFTVLISINFVAEVIAAAILTPTYVMLIKKITSKLGV